ncbi:hypothetical protein [Luteimonas huabeiensis]|uniref:hypothetical protein n=1 Tax=Luteimonas huabeiensis TaxID=1244513 RepID=UPI00069349D3|nr:hypothetical protein [Luteimonas huabeiensis]
MPRRPGPVAIFAPPLAAALLTACAHSAAPSSSTPAQESAAMSPPEAAAPAGQPTLTAEQALARLLELIRTTESVREFTPERLESGFGLPVWHGQGGRYGVGEQVTADWRYTAEFYTSPLDGIQFHLTFYPVVPGSFPDMTGICGLDFERFSAALEGMGFSNQPGYGEHGRLMSHIFDRPGMRVEVFPEGEWIWTEERGGGRACVKMVVISPR